MADTRPSNTLEIPKKLTPELPPKYPEREPPQEIEKVLERLPQEEVLPEEQKVAEQAPLPPPLVVPVVDEKTQLYRDIEGILEEDLQSVYFDLPTNLQEAFKKKGEETATVIERLLRHAKFHARKILHLIRAWLKIIPGVNSFFLEQEAKIKTDKILSLKKDTHGDH